MDIKLNDIQIHFMRCACNLKDAVLDFNISDKEFVNTYGYTKKQARREIDKLYKSLPI